MNFQNISKTQLDALKEIGNIAAGNAATSLSIMTQKKIDMDMPSAALISFKDVLSLVGGSEQPVVALLFNVHGAAPGTVYFIMSIAQAEELIQQITGKIKTNEDCDLTQNDYACSILMEVGNILVGSYLSALSDFININMQPSTPNLSIDMAGAILSVGLLQLSEVTDSAIVINTRIKNDDSRHKIDGHFFLIPDVTSVSKILTALGIENDE
ncbi:MAG TPA: chemotaxis protein CheC [Candidatus Avamphibacillus intestinigallinarum]|nr:chemotaxis protein CheC [Candidatus Avamphibacillus intestinigallinarum]